jgi:hypothetical protein
VVRKAEPIMGIHKTCAMRYTSMDCCEISFKGVDGIIGWQFHLPKNGTGQNLSRTRLKMDSTEGAD